jgi:beta-mannanase
VRHIFLLSSYDQNKKRIVIRVCFVFIFIIIGTYLLISSHAQTPYASDEAESGNLSGVAVIQSDSNASGGKYVQFGGVASNAMAVGVAVDDPNTANNPELSNYISAAGKPPAYAEWYQSWTEPLYYSSQENVLMNDNITPIISWSSNSTPLTSISNGSQNNTIDAAASLAKKWPGTLYIRFDYEMNITSSPWDPTKLNETPADYVAAWQYIVNRFKNTDGVTNVKWVWTPNIDCKGDCPFTSYYPGNNYVDMVGLDGYNYASLDGVNWRTFSDLFQNDYNELVALAPGKPIYIAEVGCAEANSSESSAGDSKAVWIQQMASTITSDMPGVVALTWWEGTNDQSSLEIQSSQASLSAWQTEVVNSSFFAGKLSNTD